MGAHLVSLALARWTHVSDRAFRLLVRMALTALDEASPNSPAGLYFGGRDLLALTLRNEGGSEKTRYRAVRRLLAELMDAGAIERTHPGRAGQNAVYRLTLDGARAIDSARSGYESQGVPESPSQEGSTGPPQEGLNVTSRVATETPPRNHEEPVEELLEEEEINLRTDLEVVGASSPNQEPDFTEEEKPRLRLVRPVKERRGLGFCWPCYDEGKTTLAVDRVAGEACAFHLRQEAS